MRIKEILGSMVRFRPSHIKGFNLLYLFVIVLFICSYFIRDWLVNHEKVVFQPILFSHHALHKASDSLKTEINRDDLLLFFFDPNQLSKDSLSLLGLSDRVIQTMLNYRTKGGRFKTGADLSKIYGMSQQDVLRLTPWVKIPGRSKNKKREDQGINSTSPCSIDHQLQLDINHASCDSLLLLCISSQLANQWCRYRQKVKRFKKIEDLLVLYDMDDDIFDRIKGHLIVSLPNDPPIETKAVNKINDFKEVNKVLDINQADLETWISLHGIGFTLAKRIVQFRSALGGFHRIDQLLDVRGLSDSTFQDILPKLYIDPNHSLQQIDLNAATLEILEVHPYIQWFHAKEMMLFKDQFGRFSSVDELLILESFHQNKPLWIKLKPYLRVQ